MKVLFIFSNGKDLQAECKNLKEYFKELGRFEVEETERFLAGTGNHFNKERAYSEYLPAIEKCNSISACVEVYNDFARHRILKILEMKPLYEE